MSITSTAILETSSGRTIPKETYKFGKAIQYSQPARYRYNYKGEHRILFNKGRYFETSIYNVELLNAICELTGFKPEFNNMIVQSWRDMEDFVIAMNILGIYVEIDIDWI